MYYPIMASLISKKKGNKLYYYVVESARVEGKPRIVQQTYLGTADRLADLLKERTAPIPLSSDHTRVRPARSVVAGRSAFRSLDRAAGDVARTAVGSLHGTLSVAGRHPPHLSARPQDRGC